MYFYIVTVEGAPILVNPSDDMVAPVVIRKTRCGLTDISNPEIRFRHIIEDVCVHSGIDAQGVSVLAYSVEKVEM